MRRKTENHIPDDVYIQFVRSLFDSVHTVAIGAVILATATFLVYWENGNPVYALLGVTQLCVGAWRYVDMLRFRRSSEITSRADAEKWENRYILRGSVQALTIGLFCFIAIYASGTAFAALTAICMSFGSLVTVAGRNYGSPRMVVVFGAAFLVPIGLGLILRGDFSHVTLGIMVFLYFGIIKSTAKNAREVLFSAVIGHRKAKQLAQRFDRALNTMPHGLVMLDPNGRVVVANAEGAYLMALSSPEAVMGRSIEALLLRGAAANVLNIEDCRYAIEQIRRSLRDGRDRKVLISLTDGRHFELSTREGRDELGVITFEDVSQRVNAEERIRVMARFDSLTGLPNRAYLHELISERLAAAPEGQLRGLAILDLDDFKGINDTLGHPIGDGLIHVVAERLSRFADDRVKIGRFGGDEFMVYFDQLANEDEVTLLLDQIFAGVQGEVDVAGHVLRVQCSGGVVLAKSRDNDLDGMIVKADLALYKAKELGKNGWRLFESVMDQAFRKKQAMKADLRSAVMSRGLRVVYQPIVAMDSMRIASCEALCRWDHPELGAISPSIFIPLSEEMGLVSEISSFVLEAATAECAKWPEPINVSVNLSAKDFRNRDIVEKVRSALAKSGLAANRLDVEVTETALLDDKSLTRVLIEEIKALGVRIALDDFGTGYSSLSYLHKLPLDKVKIDRAFLMDIEQNPRSLELLKGIVNLSRPLGLQVIIEGVETFEQLKLLAREVKPDLVQGFLFGSALSESGIQTMSQTVWPFAGRIKNERKA